MPTARILKHASGVFFSCLHSGKKIYITMNAQVYVNARQPPQNHIAESTA